MEAGGCQIQMEDSDGCLPLNLHDPTAKSKDRLIEIFFFFFSFFSDSINIICPCKGPLALRSDHGSGTRPGLLVFF